MNDLIAKIAQIEVSIDENVRITKQALTSLDEQIMQQLVDDPEAQVRLRLRLMASLLFVLTPAELKARLDADPPVASEPLRCARWVYLGYVHYHLGSAEWVRYFNCALCARRWLGDTPHLVHLFGQLAWIAIEADDYAVASRWSTMAMSKALEMQLEDLRLYYSLVQTNAVLEMGSKQSLALLFDDSAWAECKIGYIRWIRQLQVVHFSIAKGDLQGAFELCRVALDEANRQGNQIIKCLFGLEMASIEMDRYNLSRAAGNLEWADALGAKRMNTVTAHRIRDLELRFARISGPGMSAYFAADDDTQALLPVNVQKWQLDMLVSAAFTVPSEAAEQQCFNILSS